MNDARKDSEGMEAQQDAAQQSFADASAKLFAEQTAVMTMMTAASVSFATQMAGLFMGAFANAMETGAAPKAVEPEAKQEAKKVVPLRVVKKSEPPKGDDLKKISGLGPRLEKVLHGMDIRTYAAIAAWDDAEMRRIDETLGLDNRVIRDDWVGQAKALLEG